MGCLKGEENKVHVAISERAGCHSEREGKAVGLHEERAYRASVVGICEEARREREISLRG